MTDWAEEKAREWLRAEFTVSRGMDAMDQNQRLAALLREVDGRARSETLVMCCVCDNAEAPRPDCECVICHRQRKLAEVRRVVEDVKRKKMMVPYEEKAFAEWNRCCDEILSRLDKITSSKSKDNL